MSQGINRKIVELNGWKINLQICYDLRFPVWSKNRYRNGEYEYDMLIYVANWPEVRKEAYLSLIPARAIENQSYVIWVNRTGNDGNNIFHSGDSMVSDPYGKIVAQADPGKDQLMNVTLSKQIQEDFRKKFTVGMDWDNFRIDR
jgi:predicted amidohydrolase